MLSNLHITAGQKVIVYMLAKNERTDSNCYANTFYDVCPIPFYGEYNDYGGVENCYGFGLNIVVEALRSQLYEFGQGPNPYHDPEVSRATFDLEKLFDADHEGRLGIEKTYYFDKDASDISELEKKHLEDGLTESQLKELDRLANKIKKVDTFQRVTHVIIHGDILKAITDKYCIEEYIGKGQGTHGYGNNYIRTTFQDILNDIPEYIEKIKAEDKELENDIDSPDLLYKRYLRRSGSNNGSDWNNPNRVVKRLSWMMGSSESVSYSLVKPSRLIDDCREAKDYESLAELVKELMVTSWLQTFMSATRKHWTKMTGAGSQSNEADGYIVLSEATLEILKAEKSEYGEDEEDENEEVSRDAPAEAE